MGLPVTSQPIASPAAPVTSQPIARPAAPSQPTPPSVAITHAECPICFAELCKAPVGIFLDATGRRVSKHFYNLDAAHELLASGASVCPLTRKPIASVRRVPDIRTDPDAWFGTVDLDGDGRLSREEVVECFKAQLPVDLAAMDRAAADDVWWSQWDTDGSGFIERHELPRLAEFVRTEMGGRQTREIPDIRRNKDEWYRFWDEDNSGSLEKEEVVRALLKTLQLTSDQTRVTQMRQSVDAIWCIFDDDGNGSIDRDEFLKPNEGLADTIIATIGSGGM